VLASLVLMRVKNWIIVAAQTDRRRCDAASFHRFLLRSVPKHERSTAASIADAQTLKAVNDLVVQAGSRFGLETAQAAGRHHVVETDIHHPTDNTLLWDVVRVVHTSGRPPCQALEMRCIKGPRSRRSAHRRMYEIQRMTTRKRQERQTTIYRWR